MHWRVRVRVQDRPGALASLATCCGEEDVNILGLQVFPCEQGVVDELIVHAPDGWTATDVEELILRAGARDPQVLPCTVHELQDTAVRYLRAAQAVATDPGALPEQLGHLLGASFGSESADGEEMLLDEGTAPPVHLFRPTPFTPTEHARATALRQVATAWPAVPTAPAESGPGSSTTALRPGSSGDVGMLIAMHARCSAQTIQRRYHAPMPYLSSRLAHALLTPEPGGSLVMSAGSDIVGVATFARDHDGQYEAGLLVEDRWQRRGIGARLLHALGRQAASQGITTLTFFVQPGNDAMLATIRRAGFNPRVKMVDGLLQANIRVARLGAGSRPRGPEIPMAENTKRLPSRHLISRSIA
jgi:GNAT superfamily N-acetyltransferase